MCSEEVITACIYSALFMPEDTRAFYKPWAGPGRALCTTGSLLQSHVDCAPAVIQHSGHLCSCWAVTLLSQGYESTQQSKLKGQCSSGSHEPAS